MASHTPGPWVANDLVVKAPDCYGRVVCDTAASFNFEPKAYIDRAESRANANLIAATPDLLAALDANMAAMLQAVNDPEMAETWLLPVIAKSRAVIAKARGT